MPMKTVNWIHFSIRLLFFFALLERTSSDEGNSENSENFLNFKNFGANSTIFRELRASLDVSDEDVQCLNSLQLILESASKYLTSCALNSDACFSPNWAVRLIDTLPSKPSGLSRKGPFFFLGDFETCKNLWSSEQKPVHYCTAKGTIDIKGQSSPVTTGICVPSTCRESQISKIVKLAEEKYMILNPILHGKNESKKSGIQLDSVYCSDGGDDLWTFKKPFVLFVGFSILALIAVGTLVEKMTTDGLIQKKYLMSTKMRKIVKTEPSSLITDGGCESTSSSSTTSICSRRSSCGGDSSSIPNSSSFGGTPSIALTYRNPREALHLSHSLLINTLSSFSIRTSIGHLLRTSTRDVPFVNFLKVSSSFWIIFSHTCLFSLPFTDTVRSLAGKTTEKDGEDWIGWKEFMLNSSLAVDSFLFLSAFVVSYSVRKRILFRGTEAEYSILKTLSLLAHRCLRLLPSLTLYLLFMSFVYNHLADGPFWNSHGMFGSECNLTSIWPHFVFSANFFPSTCVPWLWYISLDFQLYLTLPLIFLVLRKWSFGWIFLVFLTIGCLTYRSLIYGIYTLPANMFVEMLSGKFEKAEISFRLLYTSPISRAPPFFIGIATGWYICSPNRHRIIPTNQLIRLILKLIGLIILIISLFGPFSNSIQFLIYSHAVVHRTFWSIGLSIFVILSIQNGHSIYHYGKNMFDAKIFVILSRLSFGVYLSHEPVLLYFLNTLRQPMSPVSAGYFMFISISIYVISVIFAFFIAIIIEIPLLILERKIFMKTRKLTTLPSDGSHMERHVSFSDRIEKFEAPESPKKEEEEEEKDEQMTPHEKARYWVETGSLKFDSPLKQVKIEEDFNATSTEC